MHFRPLGVDLKSCVSEMQWCIMQRERKGMYVHSIRSVFFYCFNMDIEICWDLFCFFLIFEGQEFKASRFCYFVFTRADSVVESCLSVLSQYGHMSIGSESLG